VGIVGGVVGIGAGCQDRGWGRGWTDG